MPLASKAINVLIVDDEREACVNLENLLTQYVDDNVNVVGKAQSTSEAEQLIDKYAPDALLLDIEMPKENAFNFLDRLSPLKFEVVFVTAYDEYAIKAFKLNAVDYILKPISIPELKDAIGKLREKMIIRSEFSGKYSGLDVGSLSRQVTRKVKGTKITLKDNNVIEVVDFRDIYFIEAQGSYFKVVFTKDQALREIVMCGSLTEYEELLPPELFFRVHKSYVINCQHVTNMLKGEHAQVAMTGGFTLPVSRRRFNALLDFLKDNHNYNE